MLSDFEQYYSGLMTVLRTAEAEQKRRYDSALDIEDMAEATAVTIDARTKIQHLRKWVEELQRINSEVLNAFCDEHSARPDPEDVDTTSVSQPGRAVISVEDGGISSSNNVGEYVRQKMYALSRNGYVFTDEQLRDMQDYGWSRNALNLPHPFIRIYDENQDLLEQTSINGVPRRYWVKDRFRFGTTTLLVYSGWAPLYKPFFDAWYDALSESLPAEAEVKNVEIVEPKQEEPKVGVYVRNKLRELCNSGYKLSLEEIGAFQQKRWSKDTLNLNYPFARVYNASVPLREQLSTDNGANRFWAEIFDFGDRQLLFCSQWHEGDRIYFDCWYNRLVMWQQENVAVGETETDQPTIEESDTATGEKAPHLDNPVEFALFGRSYSVGNWQELLAKLCELMILKKPYKVASLGANFHGSLSGRPILSLDERQMAKPHIKLSNGLFVDTGGSVSEIKTRCECILEACGYNGNVLQIS